MDNIHHKFKGLRIKNRPPVTNGNQSSMTKSSEMEVPSLPMREVNSRVNKKVKKIKTGSVCSIPSIGSRKQERKRSTNKKRGKTDQPSIASASENIISYMEKTVQVSLNVKKLTGILSSNSHNVSSNLHKNRANNKISLVTAFVSLNNKVIGDACLTKSVSSSMETFLPSFPIELEFQDTENLTHYNASWYDKDSDTKASYQKERCITFPVTLRSTKFNENNNLNGKKVYFTPVVIEMKVGLILCGQNREILRLGKALVVIEGNFAFNQHIKIPVHPVNHHNQPSSSSSISSSFKRNKRTSRNPFWKSGYCLHHNSVLSLHLQVDTVEGSNGTLSKHVQFTKFKRNCQSSDSSIFEGISDNDLTEDESYSLTGTQKQQKHPKTDIPRSILKAFDPEKINEINKGSMLLHQNDSDFTISDEDYSGSESSLYSSDDNDDDNESLPFDECIILNAQALIRDKPLLKLRAAEFLCDRDTNVAGVSSNAIQTEESNYVFDNDRPSQPKTSKKPSMIFCGACK